jgi:hypothetical protein
VNIIFFTKDKQQAYSRHALQKNTIWVLENANEKDPPHGMAERGQKRSMIRSLSACLGRIEHGSVGRRALRPDDIQLSGHVLCGQCVFRAKKATSSDSNQPPIPIECGHPVRLKLAA